MTCDQAQKSIAEFESDAALPETVRSHLAACPACAALNQNMDVTLKWFRTGFLPVVPDFSPAIMTAIRMERTPGNEPVSFSQWFLILLIMMAAMAVSPIGSSFVWLQARLGQRLIVPLFLTFGLAVTIYCACFIASHLDDLAERWGLN